MAGAAGAFNVREFGASGDGSHLDTAAVNRAVEACAASGGGMVAFPPGTYLCGTIRLRSRVTLFLEAGARLAGADDLGLYEHLPGRGAWHRALVLGSGLEDVAIVGDGVVDGRKVFDPDGEEKMRGPHAICLGDCRNVTIRDVTISDAANYAVLLENCDQVQVRDVGFEGGWDGVHFRSRQGEFNRDLSIIGCRFRTGDDCIAGWGMERLLVKDCAINTSCNGIRIIGPMKGMLVQGCLFFGPGVHPHRTQDRYNMLSGVNLQPGAWCACDGPLQDVLLAGCTMKDVACPVNIWLKRPGNTAEGVVISGLAATGVYRAAASVESWSGTPVGSVAFRDVHLSYMYAETRERPPKEATPPEVDVRPLPAWGLYARNVRDLVLDDVRLDIPKSDGRPAVSCENVGRLGLGRFVLPSRASEGAVVLRRVGKLERLSEEYVPPRSTRPARGRSDGRRTRKRK